MFNRRGRVYLLVDGIHVEDAVFWSGTANIDWVNHILLLHHVHSFILYIVVALTSG